MYTMYPWDRIQVIAKHWAKCCAQITLFCVLLNVIVLKITSIDSGVFWCILGAIQELLRPFGILSVNFLSFGWWEYTGRNRTVNIVRVILRQRWQWYWDIQKFSFEEWKWWFFRPATHTGAEVKSVPWNSMKSKIFWERWILF